MITEATQPVATGAGLLDQRAPLLALRGVSKRFGTVVANDDVSLSLRAGEILAVLGENGAGKTTLVQILAGMVRPDAGEIAIDGTPVVLPTPREALRHGIGTVYQHFTLVPALSVIDNLALGASGYPGVSPARAATRLRPTLEALDLAIPLNTPVRDLSMGERQRLEIAKVIARGSRILLLDEPTSVLSPGEVDGLFAILRRLSARGVGVILVTHKLREALAICDRITVMRSGRNAGELVPADLRGDPDGVRRRIIELMFGPEVPAMAAELPAPLVKQTVPAAPLLSLHDITTTSENGDRIVDGVTLDLFPGEIVGIAGVDGNGQRELAEAVTGQRVVASGALCLAGRDMTRAGVTGRRAAGLGYVTDDRHGEGAVLGASIAENLVLKSIDSRPFSRGGRIDRRAVAAHARSIMSRFGIHAPGPSTPAGRLSGGNLQKVLLARELASSLAVLVCKDPTQGLDARTSHQTLEALRAHAAAGNAVLMFSSDLDDLFAVCDRIGAMYRGRLVGVVPRQQANLRVIGGMMVGESPEPASPDQGCLR